MFKESENGEFEINIVRTKEALETNADIIATGCPFCNTMMSDGVKNKEKEESKITIQYRMMIFALQTMMQIS